MKKIVLLAFVFMLSAVPALAAPAIPDGYPPALETLESGQAPVGKVVMPPATPYVGPEIDYLSLKAVPLNSREKKLCSSHPTGRAKTSILSSPAAARWSTSTGRACPRLWPRPCRSATWNWNKAKRSTKLWWAIRPAGWWIPAQPEAAPGQPFISSSSRWIPAWKARRW